jgi:UDP-N-acetylmuramyl pentapeptide phosphotransferase/UDP-N-acetylglucosamine-1-phosphate transferase
MYCIVSKSVASVAIIAMTTVAMFVIIMDILKYYFGIDVTRKELERIRRKKQVKRRAKKHKPIIHRFVYVNAPPLQSPEPMCAIAESVV